MQKVAKEYDQTLAPLTDDLVLIDSGLDSLAFAVLVVWLEGELGVDPFTTSDNIEFPVTSETSWPRTKMRQNPLPPKATLGDWVRRTAFRRTGPSGARRQAPH